MSERHESEFTAPLSGYTNTTDDGCNLVTEALPEIKAGVRPLPDAVDTVGPLRFCQDIFELTLKERKYSTSWNVFSGYMPTVKAQIRQLISNTAFLKQLKMIVNRYKKKKKKKKVTKWMLCGKLHARLLTQLRFITLLASLSACRRVDIRQTVSLHSIYFRRLAPDYGGLPLSRNPRDYLKYIEISVLRHIRFAEWRKTIKRTTIFHKWICNLTLEDRDI